jgi:glycopeptide antibiotics resistance protein
MTFATETPEKNEACRYLPRKHSRMKACQEPLGRENKGPLSQTNHVWRRFLIGWIVLILLLCSFPWWVESPRWGRVRLIPLLDVLHGPYWVLRDAIANVLLYMPLGFAYARMQGIASVRSMCEATLVGVLVSMTCEVYQVFSPVRYPTMTDILTNSIGSFGGALIAGKCFPNKATG